MERRVLGAAFLKAEQIMKESPRQQWGDLHAISNLESSG